MTDQWRYACPTCGSRQVSRRTCQYKGCPERKIDPIDLKREAMPA